MRERVGENVRQSYWGEKERERERVKESKTLSERELGRV